MNLSRLCNFAEDMEHRGLTKDDKNALFDSLELLNRLTEDCIGSDTNTCHHQSDDQTDETTSSRVHHQSDHHGATDDATLDERSPPSHASTMPNAHVTTRADLMSKSFNHYDLLPLSFESTNSVNRHSNDRQLCDDRFITCATNGRQTRVSKR